MAFASSSTPSVRCCIALVVLTATGCAKDDAGDEGNVLPTQASAESDGSSGATADDGMTSAMSGDTAVDSTGAPVGFPQAYRFECVDIQILGDADGDALQAQVLENTWNSDIDNYKLNIIFEVAARDDEAGAAMLGIRSGIGTGAGDLCAEPTSQSDIIDVGYDAGVTTWVAGSGEACSQMADAGATSGGTYTMMLGPETPVFIYAQDTDGTTFNCTADATPDAVPVRAVEATITVDEQGDAVAGTLLGCLQEDEAMALCSCLGECNPEVMNEMCADCPAGSVPLQSLLGGINPSQRCSDLMGVPAYDIGLGFNASALPNVPTTCG